MPPEGPAPEVETSERDTGRGTAHFTPATGEQAPQPVPHPLLQDIPPMPMPYPPEESVPPASSEPGAPVVRDLRTGETLVGPEAEGILPQAFSPQRQSGGYYGGADGAPGDEVFPASFGTKTLITNVVDHPWRMNVKVAMRFGTNWFVCSGAMRDVRTVQTAGHCVFNFGGTGWADEILVYPGWDGNGNVIPFEPDLQTYGAARAIQLGSWTSWTNSGNFDFDWGVIALDRAVGALTGWYGWEYGGPCPPTGTYNVGAYPAESCGLPGLHNGQDMYYWFGLIDSCPGNQLRINTTAGCFTALWGGESGSNLYRIDGSSRFTRGIASTSNRTTIGNYVDTDQAWVDWLNGTFIPTWARGSTFDLQALDMNVAPTTIQAGTATTTLNHLGVNGTDGSQSATFNFDVRLSTNDLISTADTLLSSQFYSWTYGPVGAARINMVQVTIPENTPPGTYWLGALYNAATDGNSDNNATSNWDAQPITVTVETNPPSPNPMTWVTAPLATSPSQVTMVATTATDPVPPIQYFFNFTSSPSGGGGGTSSAWQLSSTYEDAGLQSNHNYCYQVAARDGNNNATAFSAVRCAYTLAKPPGVAAFTAITQTSIQANWTANANPVGTEYFVENTTRGTNSGWTTSTSWNSSGLSPATSYSFRVKARNSDGVETGWTTLGAATTLSAGQITVQQPNGGEVWPIGSTRSIQWTTSGITGNVKIELSRDGGTTWTVLFGNSANDGAQNWKVTGPATAQTLVRISSLSNPAVKDTSNTIFVLGGGGVTVSSPNGGEIWAIGSTHALSWTSSGITGNVRIELSRNGGTTWAVLFASTANDGAQNWKVKGPVTSQARIRVSSVLDTGAMDTSDGNFILQ